MGTKCIFFYSQSQSLQHLLTASPHLSPSSVLHVTTYSKVTSQELTLYMNKNSKSTQERIYC